jgi:hypothetical protein
MKKLLLTGLCLLSSACGGEQVVEGEKRVAREQLVNGQRIVEGGLYSTRGETGAFTVIKILELDDEGVHIRSYSNRFAEHPAQLDETTLYLAGFDKRADEELGMGHLPLSKQSFAGWDVRLIKVVPVTPDELEGYELWKEQANGSYF